MRCRALVRVALIAWLAMHIEACESSHEAPPPKPPLLKPFGVQSAPATPVPSTAQAQLASSDAVNDSEVVMLARSSAQPANVTLEQLEIFGAASGAAAGADRASRVVLRFNGTAVYRRGELPAEGGLPRRMVLDLDGVTVAPSVPEAITVNAGGLARVRTFRIDRERVRVSFDVDADTGYRLFFLTDPYRIVMDFRAQTARAKGANDAARAWTIVLDPGHGGEQPGAKGPNGLKESHVALALARRVRQAVLRVRNDVRVVMTRDEDRKVSLEERAAIANMVEADLFVSIHLNASDAPDEKGGVATFVLDTTDDQAALRLAARENETDADGVSRLQLILASLYRKDQVDHSLALAAEVQKATLFWGRKVLPDLNDRGVKRALFYVLVGARMPAILVEGSFITKLPEARLLATDEYRQALAEGISEGILRYLQRAPRQP